MVKFSSFFDRVHRKTASVSTVVPRFCSHGHCISCETRKTRELLEAQIAPPTSVGIVNGNARSCANAVAL